MFPDLIFDIGMHNGSDAEFYLKKGFRVVGVEANPHLVASCRVRLQPWIQAGKLSVVPVAIAEAYGVREFAVNLEKDDWSSLVPGWADRDPAHKVERVQVNCMPLDLLIDMFGMPYYLKIDIEGMDRECLRSLGRFSERPRYISVEGGAYVDDIATLGYKQFKLISQTIKDAQQLPNPPLEGHHVQQVMTGHHSGAFGDETYGPWLTKDLVQHELQLISESKFSETYHVKNFGLPEAAVRDSWWDTHARYG